MLDNRLVELYMQVVLEVEMSVFMGSSLCWYMVL